jgi:hypothetical protein
MRSINFQSTAFLSSTLSNVRMLLTVFAAFVLKRSLRVLHVLAFDRVKLLVRSTNVSPAVYACVGTTTSPPALATLFLQPARCIADCQDQTAHRGFHLIVREAAESEHQSRPTCSFSVHRRDSPHRHSSGRRRHDDFAVV